MTAGGCGAEGLWVCAEASLVRGVLEGEADVRGGGGGGGSGRPFHVGTVDFYFVTLFSQ